MKKLAKTIVAVILAICSLGCICLFGGCGDNGKTINVCASDIPHAEVLNGVVKDLLKEKGYTLNVKTLDWTIQNDGVANGDYDANYFQHIPYLETYEGSVELFATCKVHYEPLGIYYGKASTGTEVTEGKTFEICNDTSNAIRAFQLLEAKGVINKTLEGTNYPVNEAGDELTFTGDTWNSLVTTGLSVKLVAENLLVASMPDYDFALLPCNTAFTGKIDSSKRATKEDDPTQVSAKANVIAVRKNDYLTNEDYKAKIDALTDAMLSQEVSEFFATKYLGAMTCDSSSQIDLRD